MDMPFADMSRLVPSVAKQLGHRRVGEACALGPDRTDVFDRTRRGSGVLSTEQIGACRRANRAVGHPHLEAESRFGQSVDMRRVHHRMSVAARFKSSKLIREADNDVRRTTFTAARKSA